ncbi:hypothetical protein QL285_086478 [Trifolium repens]|nr:hypothetical protein QL285_086478 [Trifolium repens]
MSYLNYKVFSLHFSKQCETSHLTLVTSISPSNVSHPKIHHAPPLAETLSTTYTCTVVAAIQRNSLSDHLCHEDFQYKESVKPFVEPSALISLLDHERQP